MSRRELAELLNGSGALEAVLRARSWSRPPWLTVLTYHRIVDDPLAQPFDRGVIDATSREFEQQILTLRRYFTLVGVKDVLRFMHGASLPPNPALVTFDDGYRECYTKALPILREHGVKATFFIPTSYVTQRRVFWWDRISYVLRSTRADRIHLEYPEPMDLDLSTGGVARAHGRVLATVKGRHGLDIDRFLEELTIACEVPWSADLERRYADELVMTWDEIRALRRAGMDVQSHTRTHRILQNIPYSDLESELAGARIDLEDQLGEPIRALSYPVGRSIAPFPALRSAVQAAGYEMGFSNGSGSTWTFGALDPLDMRRISVERGLPDAYFRAMLAFPIFGTSS